MRCDITHLETATRNGDEFIGPKDALYRVFAVATAGCLRKDADDFAKFAADSGAMRIMLTFPERIVFGAGSFVDLQRSWAVSFAGKSGSASIGFPLKSDPSPGDRRVPVVSVFKSSRALEEDGLRPITPSDLASRLQIASAREPERPDGKPAGALFSAQPREITFTIACRAGDSGVGSIVVRTLGSATSSRRAEPILSETGKMFPKLTEASAGRPATDTATTTSSIKWEMGSSGAFRSPLSPSSVAVRNVSAVWLCLTVDTWTGRITDSREVLMGNDVVSIRRESNVGAVVDLGSESPVEMRGSGGIALGIGRSHDFFFRS